MFANLAGNVLIVRLLVCICYCFGDGVANGYNPNLFLPSAPASVAKWSVRFSNIWETECRKWCGSRCELSAQTARTSQTVPLPRYPKTAEMLEHGFIFRRWLQWRWRYGWWWLISAVSRASTCRVGRVPQQPACYSTILQFW